MTAVIAGIVKDLLPKILDLVDDAFTSKEELRTSDRKKLQQSLDHELKLIELGDKATKNLLDDKADARSMQKVALQQEDKLAKHFLYYLAIGTIGVVLFIMYKIIGNAELATSQQANMVVGGLLGILSTIIAFFFGSSLGSKDKTTIMARGK